MELSWHIREATTNDANGLKTCMESAYTEYQERMGGVRLPPMNVDYLSEITNYPTWVAESEGNILGGLIMSLENGQASIANIAVNLKYQGQGIGGTLMKFAESIAKENNFSKLHLITHVLLHENVSLYLHLGWEEAGRNEAKVFMKKEI